MSTVAVRRRVGSCILAALLVVALVEPAASANPSRNVKASLDQGRTAYDRGDYSRAIDTIRPLLYPSIELGTEDEVVTAHRLLALSYFFVNKPKEAEQEVTSLLALRPGFELDPIVDPPVAVRFFDDVRRRQLDRVNALKQREKEEVERDRIREERRSAEAKAKAERIYVDRVVERHSRLVALLPFGAGQAQNGHNRKAIAFGVGEAILGAASLAAYLAIDYTYPVDPTSLHRQFKPEDKNTATALITLQIAAGAAFWATVLWGILDAQLYFKREVVRDTRERSTPPPKRGKLSIIPAPGGVGLAGTF
ncbi:MAG: tetratricopeptide repeat domain protein [Myxococcales bacterium]|nr:tetratricopeptide repeat domain protein [Myxococcales bacterium]